MMQKRVPAPLDIPDGGVNTTQDDAVLVLAAQQDPLAFAPLYQIYRDRVYGYLLARCGDVEDAADLTQHVFLKAMDALEQYRPEKGPFVAWLFGIARNSATNFRRRSLQKVAWDLPERVGSVDTVQSLEETILRRESQDQVRRLCSALEPAAQELLALRFVAGLTFGKSAQSLARARLPRKSSSRASFSASKEQYHDISS